ncbi:MAG: tetraacyldisaccharide 4'-kinase [Blastocatellia bacterium]
MIESSLARALLYAPAKLYQFIVQIRILAYRRGWLKTHSLNAPVISVGNLSVGGTGKTPCVAFIAKTLRDAGLDVAILSRGYKRQTVGRVEVSNGKQILCSPAESGDEPFLLAQTCPDARVVVDPDRYAAGHWLESQAPVSAFILDDAYQHLRLARDLNLLLIDATEPLRQAEMVPFGRFREPLTELSRADAVIVTRSDQQFDKAQLLETINQNCRPNTPIFFASHRMAQLKPLGEKAESIHRRGAKSAEEAQRPESFLPASFAGKKIAAVSGIAKPERFKSDLQNAGMQIVLRRDFADHHRYSSNEFAEIIYAAQTVSAEAIVVTEKDAANLSYELLSQSPLPVYAAQIEFHCQQANQLRELLLNVTASNEKKRLGLTLI